MLDDMTEEEENEFIQKVELAWLGFKKDHYLHSSPPFDIHFGFYSGFKRGYELGQKEALESRDYKE